MNRKNTMILTCRFLRAHVDAAQQTAETDFPVTELDTSLHKDPKAMRAEILKEITGMPSCYETVLVSMGFCGGSWKNVEVDRRVVLPRMDDCITILLTTDDEWIANRKHTGVMYMTDNLNDGMTIPDIYRKMIEEYGEKRGAVLFRTWFHSYRKVSIIDTGVYDSHNAEYIAFAKSAANLIHGELDHIAGSNRVLTKLVSGEWDSQFFVLEPHQTICETDLNG